MQWFIAFFFIVYSGLGIATLLVWFLIYQFILARGYSLREALFGDDPNPAVALDLLGGFLATGLLIYSVLSRSPLTSFQRDLPIMIGIGTVMLIMLVLLRFAMAGLLRLWFRQRRDAQGDIVSFNNELFRQRNLATGLFSTIMYFILVAGLVAGLAEHDLLSTTTFRIERIWNMLGTWLVGTIAVVVHSNLYLGFGPRNHILHECFHDNNPGAAFSLLGLVGGILLVNNQLLSTIGFKEHLFNTPSLWWFLGLFLILVLLVRGVLQLVLLAAIKVNLGKELVIRDNVAWGILDGGLIFILFLILQVLIV